MDNTRSLYGSIAEIVRLETRYLRHYYGKVVKNNDSLNLKRVLVTVDELGWNTEDIAVWCFPRQEHSLITPEIGDYVEVYFMGGDPNNAVYIGLSLEMQRNFPKNYSVPTDNIIFESPKKQNHIKHNDITGKMDIKCDLLALIDPNATEFAVLGTQLNLYLTTLITAINATFATKLDGGGTAGALTPPVGILSSKVTLK